MVPILIRFSMRIHGGSKLLKHLCFERIYISTSAYMHMSIHNINRYAIVINRTAWYFPIRIIKAFNCSLGCYLRLRI